MIGMIDQDCRVGSLPRMRCPFLPLPQNGGHGGEGLRGGGSVYPYLGQGPELFCIKYTDLSLPAALITYNLVCIFLSYKYNTFNKIIQVYMQNKLYNKTISLHRKFLTYYIEVKMLLL